MNFRDHLYGLADPRLADVRQHDPYSYFADMRSRPHVKRNVDARLETLRTSVFEGVTSDGKLIDGLYPLGADEGAPTLEAAGAAREFLDSLTAGQRDTVSHPIDSRVWRAWLNPEYHMSQYGLRLEELSPQAQGRALGLVAASLSSDGFERVRNAMRTNGFLGELTRLPRILNEFSYNINVYGVPSPTEPWGWNLWGHHLCLNSLFVGGQQVLTPAFIAAEPSYIDAGPHAGVDIFSEQEAAALTLVRGLPATLRATATLFEDKRDPAMAPGRRHPADDLHLAGAFQDNRVIPYEGVRVADFPDAAKRDLLALVEHFLLIHPPGPRAARLADIQRRLDDTWFCWIGGTGDDDPFYFRIQSPVLVAEFDHHSGVFLANREPKKFHVHTVLRTPNGNDYGAALVRQATGAPHVLDGPA